VLEEHVQTHERTDSSNPRCQCERDDIRPLTERSGRGPDLVSRDSELPVDRLAPRPAERCRRTPLSTTAPDSPSGSAWYARDSTRPTDPLTSACRSRTRKVRYARGSKCRGLSEPEHLPHCFRRGSGNAEVKDQLGRVLSLA